MRLFAIALVALLCACNTNNAVDNCPEQTGSVLCGQCDGWSSGPHSGQCRYCGDGNHCMGDLCAEWDQGLSCVLGSGGGNVTNGSAGPGGSGGGSSADGSAAGNGSSGAAGSTGGSTGGGGGTYTSCPAAATIECSGWISCSNCSWRSCGCIDGNGYNGGYCGEYYESSDGQRFECTGSNSGCANFSEQTCAAAAQGLINHCCQ